MANLADGKQFVDVFGGSMDTNLLIVLGILGVFILWLFLTYNMLVGRRNKVQESFASIDVQLKKRYDLIPNILTIAQKFMDHERSLLEDITALRTQALQIPNGVENIGKKLELDGQISKQMGQLMVSVENYPQLKSDQTMVQAMQTYNEVEEHIAAARRFYNSAVLDMNNACEMMPSCIIANLCNFQKAPFFKVENEAERQRVDASQFLR